MKCSGTPVSQMTQARTRLGRAAGARPLQPLPCTHLVWVAAHGGQVNLQPLAPRGTSNLGNVRFASRQESVPQQMLCSHTCASVHLQLLWWAQVPPALPRLPHTSCDRSGLFLFPEEFFKIYISCNEIGFPLFPCSLKCLCGVLASTKDLMVLELVRLLL